MSTAENAVKEWLTMRGANVDALDSDYDLIENRIVDSLHFMELIMLLEQFTGRDILAEGVSLDRFRTMRAIRESFLDGADDETEEVVI